MEYAILGISVIVGLVSLGCWLHTVIVAFSNDEAVIGVLCLCPLVGLIMGFVKMNEWGHQKTMTVWGICVVINLILQGVATAMVGMGG